jgi:mannose-6-phosphate isomerase
MSGIFQLNGVVKHYDWGGTDLIPGLLLEQTGGNKPCAEYWMGTHPLGEGTVQTDKGLQPLSAVTGKLSFLMKLLDVKNMLSIQVHPSKSSAEQEFTRENAAGIPLNDPGRNYKDDNHKPELMVALSDFWLLHGFKPPEDLVYTLLNVVELRELLAIFNELGYDGLYMHIMTMPQPEVNRILQPLVQNLNGIYNDEAIERSDEDHWVAKAAATFNKEGNIDRGIFSIYLFNLVHLKKGEGIFQGAGVPHAYLEGQNVEIMANSDNVLRGGLTTKHIDVPELLKHVKCEATYPAILTGEEIADHICNYPVPVNDFRLEKIKLGRGDKVEVHAMANSILVCTSGKIGLGNLELGPGHPSAVILMGSTYTVTGMENDSIVFMATGTSTAVNK